jgi:hypothetical protein
MGPWDAYTMNWGLGETQNHSRRLREQKKIFFVLGIEP